jgi:hypothetical protein
VRCNRSYQHQAPSSILLPHGLSSELRAKVCTEHLDGQQGMGLQWMGLTFTFKSRSHSSHLWSKNDLSHTIPAAVTLFSQLAPTQETPYLPIIDPAKVLFHLRKAPRQDINVGHISPCRCQRSSHTIVVNSRTGSTLPSRQVSIGRAAARPVYQRQRHCFLLPPLLLLAIDRCLELHPL